MKNEFKVFNSVDNNVFEEYLRSNIAQCCSSNFERNTSIVRDYRNGMSCTNIARKYSLSPTGVEQILFMYARGLSNFMLNRGNDVDLYKFGYKPAINSLLRANLRTVSQVEYYIRSGRDLKAIKGIGIAAESAILDYFLKYDQSLVFWYKQNFAK